MFQLDVKNIFFNDDLEEQVYMLLSPGYDKIEKCKLKRALSGLENLPRHGSKCLEI